MSTAHHTLSRFTLSRSVRPAVVAATAVVALGLTGCGVGADLAGVEPAPTEVTTGAPLTAENATEIAERVLGKVAEARSASGEEADTLRKSVFTGPALAVATAAARQPADAAEAAVVRPAQPQVVAVSEGTGWPRVMVVTTADGPVQQIHLLTARDARTPFRIANSATVVAGQVAFSALESGAEIVSDGEGLRVKPADVVAQYAKGLVYPDPTKPKVVSTNDPFAAQVKSRVSSQVKALGELAKVTETHVPDADQTVAIRLADGGVLVFGLVTRTDTVTKSDKAQTLTYSGRNIKEAAVLKSYESLVFAVPAEGAATLVAVDEQLVSSSFR